MNFTNKELEVLELLRQGLSAEESAEKLKVSSATIRRHVLNLKMKAGAKNIPHLIHITHQNKILNHG